MATLSTTFFNKSEPISYPSKVSQLAGSFIYQDLKHLEKGKHQMKISYFKPYIELFSSLNQCGKEY